MYAKSPKPESIGFYRAVQKNGVCVVSAVAVKKSDVDGGYKQTDIGVIPSDWNIISLGEVGDTFIGLTYSPTDVSSDGTLVLRSSNVQNGRLCFDDNVFVRMNIPERAIVHHNDILICVRNGSRDLIGKSALVNASSAGLAFGAFMGLYRSEYNSFIAHAFQSEIIKIQINEHLGATINQITNKSLNGFQIALPSSVDERNSIAEALSDADGLIESLEQLIAKKRQIKQGAMQDLLTGQKRLAGFSGEWEIKTIGQITSSTAGGTPSTVIPSYWGGDIRWMNSGELNLKNVYEVEGRITEEGLKNSATKIIPSNCVLIGLAGQGKTRGTVAINHIPLCTNQSIAAIFPNDTFESKFLYYNLDLRYEELRELSSGDSGRGGLNLKIINELKVFLPSKTEQFSIAEFLADIDAEILSLETKLEKAKQIKQGMMQDLLTGRVRLI